MRKTQIKSSFILCLWLGEVWLKDLDKARKNSTVNQFYIVLYRLKEIEKQLRVITKKLDVKDIFNMPFECLLCDNNDLMFC